MNAYYVSGTIVRSGAREGGKKQRQFLFSLCVLQKYKWWVDSNEDKFISVTSAMKKIKNSKEHSKERVAKVRKKNLTLCLSEGLAFDLSLQGCGAFKDVSCVEK